jgi:hypothetical protein
MGQARVAQATFTSCLSNRCQTTRLDAIRFAPLQRPEPGASEEPAFAGFGGASFREPRNRTLRRRRIPRMIGRDSADVLECGLMLGVAPDLADPCRSNASGALCARTSQLHAYEVAPDPEDAGMLR